MAKKDQTANAGTKTKVKATPKATSAQKKPAKDVLDNVNGVMDVIIMDDDLFDIIYDEALLEEAAILAALVDAGYDVVLTDCGC